MFILLQIYITDCVKYIEINRVFYKQMQVNCIHVSIVQSLFGIKSLISDTRSCKSCQKHQKARF